MPLQLYHLDERTRRLMLAELDQDVAAGRLYLSSRLSDHGRTAYEALLRAAIEHADDGTLARSLRTGGVMAVMEIKRTPRGGTTSARVPVTAPDTLAEGEFNRFYMRGLCRRALEDQIPELVVYRAKPVDHPRSESQALLGRHLDAVTLLADLSTHQGVDTALRLPPGPNSGLSVRLPES